MHAGNPLFYQFSIKHMMINVGAVHRQSGFDRMMGNPMIASIMGPNEDMATQLNDGDVLLCQECAVNSDVSIAELLEVALNSESEKMEVTDE